MNQCVRALPSPLLPSLFSPPLLKKMLQLLFAVLVCGLCAGFRPPHQYGGTHSTSQRRKIRLQLESQQNPSLNLAPTIAASTPSASAALNNNKQRPFGERKSKYSPVKRRLRTWQGFDTPPPQVGQGNNGQQAELRRLAKQGNGEQVLKLLSKVVGHEKEQEEQQEVVEVAEATEAEKQGGQQQQYVIAASIKDFNILLKELGDAGNLDDCLKLMDLMKTRRVWPTLVSYSTVIARAGAWQKFRLAEDLFCSMEKANIRPDVQAFNSLINAYAKEDRTDLALVALAKMEATQTHWKPTSRVYPNVVTFNTIIDSCSRCGNVAKARELWRDMKSRGLLPDEKTYGSMIHALCQSDQLDGAFELLEEMKSKGLFPTRIIYSMLLHGLGQSGDLERAFLLLTEMNQLKFRPNVVTMSALVYAFGKRGQIERAFSLYQEMSESKNPEYRPNSITCSSVVDACLKAGQMDRAFKVVQDMRARNVPLTEVTYTSLITELTKLRRLDRILEVVMPGDELTNGEGIVAPQDMPEIVVKKTRRGAYFPTSAKSLTSTTITTTTTTTTISSSFYVAQDGDVFTAAAAKEEEKEEDETSYFSSSDADAVSRQHQSLVPSTVTPSLQTQQQTKSLGSSLVAASRLLPSSSPVSWLSVQEVSMLPTNVTEALALMQIAAIHVDEALEVLKNICKMRMPPAIQTQTVLRLATSHAHWLNDSSPLVQGILELKVQFGFEEGCRLLLRACGRAKSLRNALNVAEQRNLLTPSLLPTIMNQEHLDELARACKASSDYKAVVEAYEKMKAKGLQPGARVYKELLRALYEEAEELLPTSPPSPAAAAAISPYSSSSSISSSSGGNSNSNKQMKHDELFRLYLVFQEMRIAGVHADAGVYNTLINACASAGDLDKALETMQAMQEEGVAPDVITYTSLIKACSMAGGTLGSVAVAEEIFTAMQQRTNHFSSYIEPNEMTFQRLMQVHAKALSSSSSKRIWQLMDDIQARNKLTPTAGHWRMCILAALHEGDLERALASLDMIRQHTRQRFDYKAWSAVLDACYKEGRLDQVARLELEVRKGQVVYS